MDDDVPTAAQISQADIIERQAESIARLKRQVQKGSDYKQLTKSKLKEAAARLKEYRLRVETLLQAEETLKKQLKDAQNSLEKTKKQHKSALNQAVKAKKHVRNAATQTEKKSTVTRTSQTLLSGNVERVNKKILVDSGVQTVDNIVSTQTEMDQLVPKLSRCCPVGGQQGTSEDTKVATSKVMSFQEPLQILGDSTFHETSAVLDAELAFSDSDESGGTGDTLEIRSEVKNVGSGAGLVAFDLAVSSEIDKELEFSSDEEEENAAKRTDKAGSTTSKTATHPTVRSDGASSTLLGGVDLAVQREIDKELETSGDEDDDREVDQRTDRPGSVKAVTVGSQTRTGSGTTLGNAAEPLEAGGFDLAVSNEIDKDLETSSDEDVANQVEKITTKVGQGGLVDRVTQNKPTVMSIDDELDDEFAALDADSEPEHHEKKRADGNKEGGNSSSSNSSSDSDSSDSDSDSDGDESMVDSTDKSPTPITEKHTAVKEITIHHSLSDDGRRASLSSTTDKDAVVLTTPVEKKQITAAEEVYSPIVEELPSQSLEQLELDTNSTNRSKDDEESSDDIAKKWISTQESIPESTQFTKTAEGVVTDAISTKSTVTQTPSNDRSSAKASSLKQLVPDKSTVTEHEDSTTSNARQLSDSFLINSTSESSELPTNAKDFGIHSPTGEGAVGKTRTAEEANLNDSQATPLKKAKSDKVLEPTEDEAMPVATDNTNAKKNLVALAETNDQRRLKKSVATFKKAIVLGKGEQADNTYARRTMAVLVYQSCKFIDTQLTHVTTLCQILVDAYLTLEISPITVVRGTLGVFRTPRSRRLMQETKLGLSWLCNQVLIRLMCSGDEARQQDVLVSPNSLTMSLMDECLLYLQSLLIEERTNIGNFLSVCKVQSQIVTQHINVSHDKAFLEHICALHTHLCKSTGQLSRSRVLLFDIVQANPNIVGLYFAMVMVEINPAILEREFDQHCVERRMMLKETFLQVFIVISGVAAMRDERLLHQSSMKMLHRIADAIQMPELEQVDGTDPYLPRTYVKKLVDKFATGCQPSLPEEQGASPIDYFEFAKSLEICTAVFGFDLITEIFSIERCRELFVNADVEVKSGIMSIVGHIAMTIASDTQNPETDKYVECVIDWLYQVLSTAAIADKTSAKNNFKLVVTCSRVCVELILEYSASTGLDSRRRVLCAIVKWFDTVPPDQLIDLPASFLRQLRLAVVAARPQVLSTKV